MDTSDPQSALIAEQVSHVVDLLKSEQKLVSEKLIHLEQQSADFEVRIRELTASATQFKLLVSLAAGGGLLSVISLVKALFGGTP